ncbi:microtubule-associated protein 1B [Vanessa tameamea]|uniref:Microtubule-associated protein 1B n=1 Tax=Vanessa tameamea TaxID=334116 RepID=A0A8B8HI94_VANTA
MKIPETSANVGAYYGNEDSGQWQPNGVIIDNGVGGGVVGSGDAGHRPAVYPVPIPRGHIPGGYVMAGAAYPGAAYIESQDDFEDYMWMENEEEFDNQVMQQLEEEALMEQCIEAMLEDEQREQRQRPVSNGHNHYPTTSNGLSSLSLEETVSRSKLNPLAAEFVPIRARPSAEEAQDNADAKSEVESAKETVPVPQEKPQQPDEVDSKPTLEESRTEEPIPVPTEPPEVSAADVQPIDKKVRDVKKETKPKTDVKKIIKNDVKKTKPVPVKSDTKVTAKKKEVKIVKSEVKEEEGPVADVVKQSTPPPAEELQTGIKPINYAAAAKANKPKKPTTPPMVEKTPQPTKTDKPVKPADKQDKKPQVKDRVKVEKPVVQRKNSTK